MGYKIWNRVLPWALSLSLFSNSIIPGCASYTRYVEQQRKLSQLSGKYRKTYYELGYIGTKDELNEFMTLQTDEQREDFLRRFWKRRDPTPTTEINERKIEHERRVRYADQHFKAPGADFWDDRGMIYIKYGEPEYIEEKALGETGQSASSPCCGGIAIGRSRKFDLPEGTRYSWEKWYYEKYGLRFDFVQRGNTYRLVADEDIESSIHLTVAQALAAVPISQASKLYEQQREPPIFEPKYEGKHLAAVLDLATFKGKDGKGHVELYYGVPFKEFKEGGGERKLELSAVVLDENETEIARKKESRSFFVPPLASPNQFFLDELEFDIPPGNYILALRLEDKQAKKLGIYKIVCRAPDYTAKKPVISDIQFGSEIVPSKTKSRFSKDGILIVPYPTKVVSCSSPLNIYYEIYNLALGSDNRTLFSVEYTIRQHKGKEAISMTDINNKTKFRDTPKYLSWDLSDTKPGKYDLVITVEDLNSGSKDTALTTFMLIR
jgi:GWxTD domain-containing protein